MCIGITGLTASAARCSPRATTRIWTAARETTATGTTRRGAVFETAPVPYRAITSTTPIIPWPVTLGISARLRDWAERHTRFKAMQVTHYAIAFLILNAVLTFPLSVYEGFYREHQYGLATQTFGGWIGDRFHHEHDARLAAEHRHTVMAGRTLAELELDALVEVTGVRRRGVRSRLR